MKNLCPMCKLREKAKGLSKCGECNREYAKEWYQKNKEKVKKWRKNYYLLNKEKSKEYQRKWIRENKSKVRIRSKKYYEAHKKRINMLACKWRQYNLNRYKAYRKDYDIKNKDKIKEVQQKYRDRNKNKIKNQVREYYLKNKIKIQNDHKKWREQNLDYARIYRQTEKYKKMCIGYRRKRLSTLNGRLGHNMLCAISAAIKSNKAGRRWEDLVGYTVEDLKNHLEFLFTPGMSWNNYGKGGWSIDHIRPRSSFHYNYPKDPEFKKCWSLNNLQPLWAIENSRKHAKWNGTDITRESSPSTKVNGVSII